MRLFTKAGSALVGAILILETLAIAPVMAAVAVDAVDDGTALVPYLYIPEDASATNLDVLANDMGPDGVTPAGLTITAKTDGTIGTVAIDASLLFVTYTPDAEASGPDSFTYTVSDGSTTDTATVYVSVNALNDAPSFDLGADPSVAEDSGAATVVGFAVGSPGPPNESAQTLTYFIDSDSNPDLFSVAPEISPAGDLTFTPAADANGSATLVAHVEDNGPNGDGDVNFSPPTTFHITVTPVNDAPVAVADGPYGVPANTVLNVAAGSGVLANDTDIDTLHTALTAVVDATTTHGALTLNADGSFSYTPTAAYVGADSFTYHANDGSLDSNVVSVSLTVTAESAPVANNDSATITTGSDYRIIDVLGNDTDADDDTLTIVSATVPAHGRVQITNGGTVLRYRPAAGFVGTDTFSYTITDGVLTGSAVVTVHVVKDVVKPVVSAPVQTIGSQIVGATTVKVHLSWGGTDTGSGISKFELWESTDGHAFTKVKSTTAQSANVVLTRNHTYRFRVRAIDKAGNIGAYAYGPTLKSVLYQETSARYPIAWNTVNSTSYLGGHARKTSTAGRSVILGTTGRTFTWIGAHGPTRSTADVYIDGVLKAHVNLFSTVTSYRRVIYSITFASKAAHQIRIVYTGPTSGRIDFDALVVLR